MDDSSVAAGTHHREGGEGAIEHRLEVEVDHLGGGSRGEIAPVALLDIAAGGIDEDERVAERRHDFRMGAATAAASETSAGAMTTSPAGAPRARRMRVDLAQRALSVTACARPEAVLVH